MLRHREQNTDIVKDLVASFYLHRNISSTTYGKKFLKNYYMYLFLKTSRDLS